MGVFERKRKSGVTYYVSFIDQTGKLRQERAGSDKGAARRLLTKRKREVADGTYAPEFKTARVTLRAYAASWGEKRTTKTANDDRSRLRDHVLPILGDLALEDIQPRHAKVLVDALKKKPDIGPKTIRNVVGTARTLLRDARFEGLIAANPFAGLPKGIVPPRPRVEKPIYELGAVVALLTSDKIPLDRRVFYALALCTGMRHGEAAGRRWRHYDPNSSPLGCLSIETQYDDQELKSPDGEARPRKAPVHPELARILAEWKLSGFAQFFGRAPRPDDFIVPSRRGPQHHRTVRRSLTNLVERDCPAAGVEARTFHRFRDTFLSLCRRSGARKDVIEKVTHNARGEMVDQYTHWDWAPLCEAVLCLPIKLAGADVIQLPVAASGGGGSHDVPHDADSRKDESQPFQAGFVAGRTGLEALPASGKRWESAGKRRPSMAGSTADSSRESRSARAHDARHVDDEAEAFAAAVAEDAERAAVFEVLLDLSQVRGDR